MKLDFDVGSEIKVICNSSAYYKWRGSIVNIIDNTDGHDSNGEVGINVICKIHDKDGNSTTCGFDPSAIACIQKKFVDIQRAVENDYEIVPGVMKCRNIDGFEVGDIIQISEKIDGANASISYNPDEQKLEVFSRTHQLNAGGLRGFYDYIITKFGENSFSEYPNLTVFGEWLVAHNCIYDTDRYNKWYVYDIWDKSTRSYCNQDFVKDFCNKHGLIYVHVLYEGPFVSWDHCRSFCHYKTYGKDQEGIVIKNQTKLNAGGKWPHVLKIVNDEFIETKHTPKELRPETIIMRQLEAEAMKKMEVVLTKNRVQKILLKCVDNGILPREMQNTDIPKILKVLPKLVYEDLLKEENEVMKNVAENAGKLCAKLTTKYVRELVLGY